MVDLSDHEMVGCIRKLNNVKFTPKVITCRNYSAYEPEVMKEDFRRVNWQSLYTMNDINKALEYFNDTVKAIFDRHAPQMVKKVRGKPCPWINSDIRKTMSSTDCMLRKARRTKKNEDHCHFKKRRFLPQNTIKFNCPARIRLQDVINFLALKIRDDTARLRRDMSETLKKGIADKDKPLFERRIYIHLPKENEHEDQPERPMIAAGGILQPIDKRIVRKIEALVGEGVKTVGEMKRHLQQFVKHELFQDNKPCPSKRNRRYYPNNVDIRNHMYRATVKNMLSKIDQENLEKKIETWKKDSPDDSIFFRTCSVSPYDKTSEDEKDDITANYKILKCLVLNVNSETTTYICDFHREQAWERWLKKGDNGLTHKRDDVLKLLQTVAKSNTEDD
ncbi:Calcium-responsive transcription factor [Paramuricea clavata]|uniref:Calcium-responsive transcription factor n=1 Tax=Paramuricea clavata TaxID=317549 RepID=A0A6S7IFR5_PARCT|nr:Calcium-responsive transcription factor [Paramuricea clavata]